MKDKNTHRIILNDGIPETENFQTLQALLIENEGSNEGIVNPKFTPFPKRYKDKTFEAILGSGEMITVSIVLKKAGFIWMDQNGKNLNGRIMAWREKTQEEEALLKAFPISL